MRTTIFVLLIGAVCFLSACGGPEAGATPKETFEAWHAAQIDEDWEGLFELLSPTKRAEAEKAWGEGGEFRREAPEIAEELGKSAEDVLGMSVMDIYVALNKKEFEAEKNAKPEEFAKRLEEFKGATLVKEETEGDKSKVFFKFGDRERSLRLVRVEGKWYLDRGPLN